jgi:hypothetical protein
VGDSDLGGAIGCEKREREVEMKKFINTSAIAIAFTVGFGGGVLAGVLWVVLLIYGSGR